MGGYLVYFLKISLKTLRRNTDQTHFLDFLIVSNFP